MKRIDLLSTLLGLAVAMMMPAATAEPLSTAHRAGQLDRDDAVAGPRPMAGGATSNARIQPRPGGAAPGAIAPARNAQDATFRVPSAA